jgi:hypothetical protein
VDLWVNGTKAFDNVAFRKASAFVDVPANTPLVVGLAPATSSAYKDTIGTITLAPLRPSRTYTIVATGVSDTSKFAKNPDGLDVRFNLLVFDNALEKNPTTKTGVRTFHAVSDAPRVSFAGPSVTFASKIGYGEMSGSYIETEPGTDTVWMSDANGKKLKGYICDFRGAARATIMIATGFLDPAANGSGPGLAVILVDANGNVNSNVIAIDPDPTSVPEDDLVAAGWRVSPNPSSDLVRLFVPVTSFGQLLSFELLSITGQAILGGELLPQDGGYGVTINASSLPQGTYRIITRSSSGQILGSMGLAVTR